MYADFLTKLSKPARNALMSANINSFIELAQHTEKEILALHGIGRASLPTMYAFLSKNDLSFKQK